jgi:hypothetical protein
MIMPSKLEESLTSEQRLDRLELIAKLFVAAGLRARRNMREMDEKMNILIDAQIRNEERFAKSDERFAKSDQRFARSDERFARFEVRMDQTLRALMEIAKKRDGNS